MSALNTELNEQEHLKSLALLHDLLGDQSFQGSWIDGEHVVGKGQEISLINPSSGQVFMQYYDAEDALIAMASEAASRAQKIWWNMTASARAKLMWQCGEAIRASAEALAQLESFSAGKPIRDCRVEVAKVAEMFEYYAGWCDKLMGEVIPVPTSHLNYTRHEPYGVVAQITPWNAPVFTCGWQIAPALCTGNAVLLKPSELTPLSSVVLATLIESAGIPQGLVNIVNGFGHTTGSALINNSIIQKVVFVGSANTGSKIAASAAKRVIPCVLELGGKSANIIFNDADIDRAVVGAQAAVYSAAGQSCVSGSRLLIHEKIYERVIEQLSLATDKIAVGMPELEETMVGPINNIKQFDHIKTLVNRAEKEGASIAAGGRPANIAGAEKGYFYKPTLLSNVENSMPIAQEEIFGPVISAISFSDEEEAIHIANDSRYGLAGAIWTNNVGLAHRMASKVNAGTFWVNSYKAINVMSPFGGFGESGYGRSSGYQGLLEYTRTKSVWVETADNPPMQFGYSVE